jgi:membrane associated rhomboid family serine protease
MAVCPKCLTDMRLVNYQHAAVDVCPTCRGIWLDPGELALLRGADQDVPANASNQGMESHPETSTYICPRCEGGFDTFEYISGSGLYIDRCKECRGIWLDAGELKKIRALTPERSFFKLEPENEDRARLRKLLLKEEQQMGTSQSGSSPGLYFFQLLTGLPVEVNAPRARFPVMTLLLILVNAFVFLYQLGQGVEDAGFYQRYAFIPNQLNDGGAWPGLFSSLFLHGSFWHLFGNMYFLWLFGDNVEDRLNRPLFLFFYFVCGVLASLIHGWMTHDPQLPTLGASGAISGIMGAYWILYPRQKLYQVFWFMQFKISVTFYLLFWLGLQLFFSSLNVGGVAWFAHVGGFVIGALGMSIFKGVGLVKPDPSAHPLSSNAT